MLTGSPKLPITALVTAATLPASFAVPSVSLTLSDANEHKPGTCKQVTANVAPPGWGSCTLHGTFGSDRDQVLCETKRDSRARVCSTGQCAGHVNHHPNPIRLHPDGRTALGSRLEKALRRAVSDPICCRGSSWPDGWPAPLPRGPGRGSPVGRPRLRV